MPADVYVQDGVVYPDEATAVVAMHPNIPEELKRVFITKPDKNPDTKDNNVYEPPAILDQNILTPRGLEGNQQFQQDPELETPIVYPTPDYLNPPEKGPGFESPPRPEPKVLFTTKTGVEFTDHDIENAIHVAMSVGAGTMAGVKSARNLGRLNDLGHAQVLEDSGAHPDKTFYETGWYRGSDNRWRHEISDDTARLNEDWWDKPAPQTEIQKMVQKEKAGLLTDEDRFRQIPFDFNAGKTQAKLSEVIEHPELYKAYPHLKDVDVVKDPSVATAHWDEANNIIAIGSEPYNNMSTFLHEIQHAVQSHENFARGAAPGIAGTHYTLKYAKAAQEQIIEPLKKLYNKLVKQRGNVATQEELDELTRLQMMAGKYNEYARAGNAQAYENYMNAAGEVEARNTEVRMLMNDQERRATHPYYTAETDQPIINFKARATTPYDRRRK